MSTDENSKQLKAGIYQHFKGRRYEVHDVARHSETGDQFVVYRALYGERDLWLRPLAMFVETIERDGERVKRFAWLADSQADLD